MDQGIGRINARERYVLEHFDRIQPQSPLFSYSNIHFWPISTIGIPEFGTFVRDRGYRYFILEYWSLDELNHLEQYLREQGTLVAEFRQSAQSENYDIGGNFQSFNSILFHLDRLGPTVAVYELQLENSNI